MAEFKTAIANKLSDCSPALSRWYMVSISMHHKEMSV